jgi:hypothetical protein
MSITLEQAKNLRYGQIIYYKHHKNSDGSLQKWKVNGKVKTWKKDESKVKVPLKHGLRSYGYVTESNLDCFFSFEDAKFEVTNCLFNRNNNPHLIGKVYNSPPSYLKLRVFFVYS